MKITATLVKNQDGELIFKTGFTPQLEGEKFNLEIKPYKSSRSLEQNRMMWAIIQDIAKATANDEMDIYIAGLEHANAKSEFILGLPQIEDSLRKAFRAVKIMESRQYNGRQMYVYKCYIGSSKFDTSEMTTLIDFFIRLSAEYGISIN